MNNAEPVAQRSPHRACGFEEQGAATVHARLLRQWLIDCDGIRFLAYGQAPAVDAEVAVRADHVIVLELVGVS